MRTSQVLEILHRRLVALIGLLAAAAVAVIYITRLSNGPLRDDAQGYYLYLPAIWLYHNFGLTDPRLAHPPWAFHYFAATGHNGDIYQFGVALLCSPLFLLAHYTAVAFGVDPQGYSTPEQLAAITTAVVMLCVGAWCLRRSLDRGYPAPVVMGAIVCVVFGSSVFDYAAMDSLYSHIFAFGLVCALPLVSEAWRDAPGSLRRAALVGLVGGLLMLVRLSDSIFLMLPFLYVAFAEGDPRSGLLQLWARRAQVLTILLVAFAVYLPQLLFFHYSAGFWTTNLYLGVHFSSLQPKVLESLFSFDPHGYLPYAPVLVLAVPGFVVMAKNRDPWTYPLLTAWLVNLYVVTSWPNWSYGSGFGLRPFVDSTGLLALPLAALFGSVRGRLQLATLLLSWLLVMTTVVQMIHYWRGLIPWTGIDPVNYFRVLFSV
jgi:hypothetical protein